MPEDELIELVRQGEDNVEGVCGEKPLRHGLGPLLPLLGATGGTVPISATAEPNDLFMSTVVAVPEDVAIFTPGAANDAVNYDLSIIMDSRFER